MAENLRAGLTRTVQWHELTSRLAAGAHLIDVRSPAEHAAGHIPGAVNVPLDVLRDRLDELPAGELIVYCQVGQRGHTAAMLLRRTGREASNLDGGYRTWAAAGGVG
ncbi:rhodanese-like domain-containing protein [Micromonospora globispora]|uniref:rhodanese-like domain-containing protein n=1 Tax=Micromonospora globispora TaxID=1450148 RepID=UPI001FAE91EC|nr:rhodanese-like domain-containing protein [Micromonospora globispora]